MKDPKIDVTKVLLQHLPKGVSLSQDAIYQALETPKEQSHGDLSFPCFMLAKALKQAPPAIALSMQTVLSHNLPASIAQVKALGPYLNFYLNKEKQAQDVIGTITTQKDKYGAAKVKPKKYAIEYPGPNTNKPLHLGHAKVMFLGKCIVTLLQNAGHKVYSVNINNDRGVHICKSMLAYKLYGNNAKPNKKSDHFVGDWYVRYQIEADSNPKLEEEVQKKLSPEILRKLTGDEKLDYDAFRKYCYYVSNYFIITHDGFDLYSRVMECYKSWKTERGRNR